MTETAVRPAHTRKAEVVDEIRAKFDAADAAVLTEYRGLTVPELARLRGQLKNAGTEYRVYKNSLARRAAEQAGLNDILEWFEGPIAIAFVSGDAVPAAKALKDFGKDAPALVIKGGLLAGRKIDPRELSTLADLPTRDVLLAKLAGGFQAPMAKAAGLFQAFTRNAAYAFKGYIDQRVAAGETAEVPAEPVAAPPETVTTEEAETETEPETEETSE